MNIVFSFSLSRP